MNPYILILYYGLVAIFYNSNLVMGFGTSEDRKCKYSKTEKGLRVRCYNLNLKEVPQHLTTNIDVLDLSYNRIKKLKKTSFERYNNIEYLLIYDNMIQSIEPNTFVTLTSLQEIDLSNNALTTIPLEILQLPSLRNLYVDNNDLINLQANLQNLQIPIRAPLEYLNIAECGLKEIPFLGVLPRLWHLNASKNSLDLIDVQQLAPLCNLKSVDLTETEMPYCACHSITNYIKHLGLKTDYLTDCDKDIDIGIVNKEECPVNLPNITINSIEYLECHKAAKILAGKLWYFIGGGAIGILIVFSCLLWWCSRSRRRKQLQIHNNNPIIIQNGTDEHLLRSSVTP